MAYTFKDEREYNFMWKNNGALPASTERLSIADAISTSMAPMWLPKVVQQIVTEAAEPLLVGTSLLQRVEYHNGQTISFPAVGALVAADMAEGQAYPEKMLAMGGATVTASVGKVGVAVKITEEMIRFNQFDVIGMHLRACGRALARHKEQKIFNYITSMGTTCFDNLAPTSSVFGVTHGRALAGAANGSVIMDDIFDAYSQLVMQGFTPNTLLMHPLTWTMFAKDPVLRAMALASGGGSMFGGWTGNPAGRFNTGAANQGGFGISGGQNIVPGGNAGSVTATGITGYPADINSAPVLPNYFPFAFRIIVSPFVRFDPSARLTDIMLFDSAELGALIVDQEIETDEWTDKSVDITKIKMRERYGIGIFNEGMAIGVLKNVKVVANEVVLPAQATLDVSSTALAAISATTPLSL